MSCSEYEMKFNITPMQAKQFRKSGLLPPKMKKKERIKQLEARVRELEEQNCSLKEKFVTMVCGTDEQKAILSKEYRLEKSLEGAVWFDGLIKRMGEPITNVR